MIELSAVRSHGIQDSHPLLGASSQAKSSEAGWKETAWKVARTLLLFPLLKDAVKAGFHWIAGKMVLPASINFKALQVAVWVLAFLFFPISLCFCFNETSSWGLKITAALLYTLVFPLGCYVLAQKCSKICAFLHKVTESGLKEKRQELFEMGCERVAFSTRDGCELDGMLYFPPGAPRDKLLIYVGGNGAFYEHSLQKKKELFDQCKLPVLVFNPRGAGASKGSPSAKGLALDVEAAYDFGMARLGINAGDIAIYGHSLGGAMAIQGAALIQARYPGQALNVVIDRSFATLDLAARHRFGNGKCAAIASKILKWTGWEMDSRAALEKLNGQKLLLQLPADDDTVIPQDVSLKHACNMVRLHTLELDHQFAIDPLHLRELNASEQVFVADKINAFLGTSASRFPPHVNRLDLKITYMNEVLQARGIAPIRRLA